MRFRENNNFGWVYCKAFSTEQFVSQIIVWWRMFSSKYQCYLPYLQVINNSIIKDLTFSRCSFFRPWECVPLQQKCDFGKDFRAQQRCRFHKKRGLSVDLMDILCTKSFEDQYFYTLSTLRQ